MDGEDKVLVWISSLESPGIAGLYLLSRCSKGLQEEVTHRQRKDDVTRFRFGCLTEPHTIGGESLDHPPRSGVVPEGSQPPLLNALPYTQINDTAQVRM